MRKKEAILWLPKSGKKTWTALMEGSKEINPDIEVGQPIVMSTATFDDGFWVAGGVYKSEEPEEYNIKFFHVFSPDGFKIPYLIDPSDEEDFRESGRKFYLNDSEKGDLYVLKIKEKSKEWGFSLEEE